MIFALAVALTNSANASDAKGRYWIYGEGRQSCANYLEARQSGGVTEKAYKDWIGGYITASNRLFEDNYNLLGKMDFQGALSWLDNYCKKSPENTLYMAMANMVAVLYPDRRKSK